MTIGLQLFSTCGPALALPNGAQVTAGGATVDASDPAALTVTQTTNRAIINWSGFSSAAGETVRFQQPGAGAVVLNRVTGAGASRLDGSLNANGRVFLLNPNGVVLGSSARFEASGTNISLKTCAQVASVNGDSPEGIVNVENLGTFSVSAAGSLSASITSLQGDVQLGGVTGESVSVFAPRGSILAAAPNTQVQDLGAGARLVAGGSIGSAAAPLTLNDLGPAFVKAGGSVFVRSGPARAGFLSLDGTAGGDLVARACGPSGNFSTGGLTAGGRVDVQASGSFTACSPGLVVSAASLRIVAGGGIAGADFRNANGQVIPLRVALTSGGLEAVGGTGDVLIAATTALTISTISAGGKVQVDSTGDMRLGVASGAANAVADSGDGQLVLRLDPAQSLPFRIAPDAEDEQRSDDPHRPKLIEIAPDALR